MLAVLSTVRLHKVQAMMNLRQAVEAGACAAYAIANPDHTHFVDADEHGILDPSQNVAKKRYRWLDQNYADASKAIQEIKDKINATTAHANLINAYGMSEANETEGWFSEPFFDKEDAHFVKTDLWMIATAALTLMHVFYEVNENVRALELAIGSMDCLLV
jgi:Mlc titration factor MtfA (ptsG expression regulator)